MQLSRLAICSRKNDVEYEKKERLCCLALDSNRHTRSRGGNKVFNDLIAHHKAIFWAFHYLYSRA